MKNDHIRILIGYMVFLTSEENRIVILLATWPPCLGRRKDLRKNLRKDYFGFFTKKEEQFFQ